MMKRERVLLPAAALLLSLLWACAGTTDTVSKASPMKPVVLPEAGKSYKVVGVVKGLKKYVIRYSNGLYRGGDILSEEGMKALDSLNIKKIIAVTPTPFEEKMSKKYNIRLVKMPFKKEAGLSRKDIQRFLMTIKKGGSFYVHCHGGSHRAGILCMTARLYADNWSYAQAEKEFTALGGDIIKDRMMLKSIRNFKRVE